MSIFRAMQINTSGLNLERLKLDTISTNITNMNTTRTEEGGPYRRKVVLFTENLESASNRLRMLSTENGSNNRYNINKTNILNERTIQNTVSQLSGASSEGVKVIGVGEDNSEMTMEYDPEHPDADENGYVTKPNVNMVDEMIDLIKTQRSYEANVTALNTSKSILKKALEITKG